MTPVCIPLPEGQQGRKPEKLAAKNGKPRLFPRPGKRTEGSALAKGASGQKSRA